METLHSYPGRLFHLILVLLQDYEYVRTRRICFRQSIAPFYVRTEEALATEKLHTWVTCLYPRPFVLQWCVSTLASMFLTRGLLNCSSAGRVRSTSTRTTR